MGLNLASEPRTHQNDALPEGRNSDQEVTGKADLLIFSGSCYQSVQFFYVKYLLLSQFSADENYKQAIGRLTS